MIKALNIWSIPGGLEGDISGFEAIKIAQEYGFEAVELAFGDGGKLPLSTTEAQCQQLRIAAKEAGIKLETVASGTYWGRALGDASEESRKQAVDDLKKLIQITAWLGAKVLLTIPGAVDVFFLPDRPAQPYDDVMNHATAGLKEVLPMAAEHKVILGIENVWNRFIMSPLEMVSFLESFDTPWIGAYFDVGNVLPFGYPEQWIRILGRRIAAVHFKDYRRAVGTVEGFVDLLEGDVNWPAVVEALSEAGYRGPVTAEMIPGYKHHPMVRLENTSRSMDAILERI